MSILGLFIIGPVFHVVENYILFGNKSNPCFTVWFRWFGDWWSSPIDCHQVFTISSTCLKFSYSLLIRWIHLMRLSLPWQPKGAATVAVAFKTKNPKLKALAFPAALSAFLGITEPAIFEVNLRYRKPFFLSLIAGAIGGGLASLLDLLVLVMVSLSSQVQCFISVMDNSYNISSW